MEEREQLIYNELMKLPIRMLRAMYESLNWDLFSPELKGKSGLAKRAAQLLRSQIPNGASKDDHARFLAPYLARWDFMR